jgi:DNA polymerase V
MNCIVSVIVGIHVLEAGPSGATVLMAPVAVPAGYPSPAQDYFDSRLDLNEHLIQDITSTFIVRVSGHSMEGAGISDGDELIVNRALVPKDGSVVIAVLDGELTIKRLQVTKTGVVLQAENPKYPDIKVPAMSELTIWGTATTCLHHL